MTTFETRDLLERCYQVLRDINQMMCFQPDEEWTEASCEKWACKFYKDEDCTIQNDMADLRNTLYFKLSGLPF